MAWLETKQVTLPVTEPCVSAQAAGLRYVTDAMPGIRRQCVGSSFRYLSTMGHPIDDHDVLQRIIALRIPPAWTDVWICPLAHGHLQATGRDDRGRKQYRYHARWCLLREETKYDRMLAFGAALARIRKQIEHHLSLPGLPREKVLATVVRLLDMTLIRVGNEEYARTNGSYGLTTMRDRHVKIAGSTLRFCFRGKSGKQHTVTVENRRLAKIIQRCQDLPGQELFQYRNEQGQCQTIESADVNAYLQDILSKKFTAKDFRTWAGTVLMFRALQTCKPYSSQTQAKKHITSAIKTVAEQLGNTPAVCRKCYIHPEVLNAYLDGSLFHPGTHCNKEVSTNLRSLRAEEVAVLTFLHRRVAAETPSPREAA
jgi:DNA topoisomerase-1